MEIQVKTRQLLRNWKNSSVATSLSWSASILSISLSISLSLPMASQVSGIWCASPLCSRCYVNQAIIMLSPRSSSAQPTAWKEARFHMKCSGSNLHRSARIRTPLPPCGLWVATLQRVCSTLIPEWLTHLYSLLTGYRGCNTLRSSTRRVRYPVHAEDLSR
jgi:hypothetical protein